MKIGIRFSAFAFISTLVLSIVAISPPARADSISFDQVSWGDGNGGYENQNSAWGQVDVGLSALDAGSLTPDGAGGYYGYVNVVTTVAGGGVNNWAVQNMLLTFNSLSDLSGGEGATTADFNLGQADGTAVSSLNYSLTLSATPLASEPGGPLTLASVNSETVVEGTTTDMSDPGDESGEAPADYVGAGVGTAPSRGASGSISTNETSVAGVAESLNGCAVGAAARSIRYLAQTGQINFTNSAQSIYTALTNSANMNVKPGNGTPSLNGNSATNSQFANGKNTFVASNGLNIANVAFTNSPLFGAFFGNNGSGAFNGAITSLRSNGDVEVYFNWGSSNRVQGGTNFLVTFGAHTAFVSSITPVTNAAGMIVAYTIRTVDSRIQDGMTTNNAFRDYTILPNGQEAWTTNSTIQGRGVVGFFMENPIMVPEPTSLAMAAFGLGALGLSLIFRKPKRSRS